MKRILNITYTIVLIVLLSYQLFATNWYVDNTASGSNNGTSWTNAWQSLADINWASISAGDNIYISGGSSGKVYAEQLAPECIGTAVNYISILPGKYSPSPSGHNGKVTIKYVLVNGDVVYVETVTGASYSTGYTETIVAGGVSRDFTVTTKAYVPPSGSRKILKGKTGKVIFDKNGKVIYTQ